MDVSDETVGCLASTGALGLLIVAFLHGPACGFLFLGLWRSYSSLCLSWPCERRGKAGALRWSQGVPCENVDYRCC